MAQTVHQPTIIDPTQQASRPVAPRAAHGSIQPVGQPLFPPGVEGIQQQTTRTPLVNISRTKVHYESHVTHHAPTPAGSRSTGGGIGLGTKVKLIAVAAGVVFLLSQHPDGLAGGVTATAGVIADLLGLIFNGTA